MRDFAGRLIACESSGRTAAGFEASAAFPVPEKLRGPLTVLMGHGGFRALLSRALALATEEVRWLGEVRVNEDGTFEGVKVLQARIDPDEFHEGRVVLVAELLGLLIAFIGSNLTSRLVREIWPQLGLDDLELANGNKNENTK